MSKQDSRRAREHAFGPNLTTFIGLASSRYRLSKRLTQSVLSDFGIAISTGSIIACEQEVSAALSSAAEEITRVVQSSDALYADETSWLERGHKTSWLWTAVGKLATTFRILHGRGGAEAKEFLGDFSGVLSTDRLRSYNVHTGERQSCWAHLLRHFASWSEAKEETERHRFAKLLLDDSTRMLKAHRAYRALPESLPEHANQRGDHLAEARVVAEQIRKTLKDAKDSLNSDESLVRQCRSLVQADDELFRFLLDDLVEPTNNAAERALRPAVITRKTSFGTQSEKGSTFLCTLWSVIATLRARNADLRDFVVRSIQAARDGQLAPTLPAPA